MTEAVVLPPSLREKGYRLVWREETGSTNADALEAGRTGQGAPCWFVADQQISGRGRSGRQWVSPPGNLYASLLLRNPCALLVTSQLGFVTGIALHDALVAVSGIDAARLRLKWPNDVLLDGRKIVGLLLEGQSMGTDHFLAIGCGINIAHKPEGMPYPVAALSDEKAGILVGEVFTALSLAFDRVLSLWNETGNGSPEERFAPIRALWLERAILIGAAASVTLSDGKVSGIFNGIDAIGRLELQTDDGLKRIDAGDVFFPSLIS